MSEARSPISLCVIARDEEEFLPGLLASARDLVAQIVLLDTGSRDRTPEIARAAGAEVYPFAWIDDFAAARNAALARARHPWILWLDADERLAPAAPAAIGARLSGLACPVQMLPLSNAARLDADPAAILSGAAALGPPTWMPRLLRRDPELRWIGRIHENVGEWVARREAERLDAPILHYGYAPEILARKQGRNLALLRRRAEEEPDSVPTWGHLANELLQIGDEAGATAAAERGWQALQRAVARPGPRPAMVMLLGLRARLQLRHNDLAGVAATLDAAFRWSQPHPNLLWLAAQLTLIRAEAALQHVPSDTPPPPEVAASLQASITACQRALALRDHPHGESPWPGVTDALPRYGVGRALLLLGRHEEAIRSLAEARALPHAPPELPLVLAEARLLRGEIDAAAAQLGEVAPELHATADLHALWAEICVHRGDIAGAIDRVRQAVRAKRGWIAPHLATRVKRLVVTIKSPPRS